MLCVMGWVMVFNATLNNISILSWRSLLLVEEIKVPEENYRFVASHWQTYHIMLYLVYLAISGIQPPQTLVVTDTDCTGSCKSNYHTTTTTPFILYINTSPPMICKN